MLNQIDYPLYVKLHQNSFKELIENYSEYLDIGFAGRFYTDIERNIIENTIEKLARKISKTKVVAISFSIGIYRSNIFTDYKTEKAKGWDLNENNKGIVGFIREGEYWKQGRKEETIKKIKEAWQWQ